jgi:hypothetical protein
MLGIGDQMYVPLFATLSEINIQFTPLSMENSILTLDVVLLVHLTVNDDATIKVSPFLGEETEMVVSGVGATGPIPIRLHEL